MESIEFKACELELKSDEQDPTGVLEGYAATWSGPDRSNEIICKGAFTSSLAAFLESGFLAHQHDWKAEIGTIEAAEEDATGLLIRARFYDTPDAQVIRRKLAAKIARGRRPGMSIGYKVLRDHREKGVRHLDAIDLYECSVVSLACNSAAAVSAIKSVTPDDALERSARLRRLLIDSRLAHHRAGGL